MLRLLALLTTLLMPALPACAQDVRVFAAASLKTALDDAAEAYEGQSAHRLRPVYAGSSALARQIMQGAPADIFISANVAWAQEVARALNTAEPVTLARNRLVVIGPTGSAAMELADLPARLGLGPLALALVDAVPAGLYARAALEHGGLWEEVERRVAQTDNVRAALALVAIGAAPFGIVYATDAAAEPRVEILADMPAEAHPEIAYPALALNEAEATRDALAFLSSETAQTILRNHGFAAP